MVDLGFELVIFSARAGTELGINAIWAWLNRHGLAKIVTEVTNVKQYRFAVFLDDRAIHLDPQNSKAAIDYNAAALIAARRVGLSGGRASAATTS